MTNLRTLRADQRALHYGDNLTVLREQIASESVDLIYLDPPFNSNVNYNVTFRDQDDHDDTAQVTAFVDTWHWGPDDDQTLLTLTTQHGQLAQFLSDTVQRIGKNDLAAYLVMMGVRLIELHRVLKSTGSIYLHCDPTASHYLKVMMDVIFGIENFRNEIIWKRSDAKGNSGQGAQHYGRNTDTILFYSKGSTITFNQQYTPLTEEYVKQFYRHVDDDGRRYKLDNMLGPGGAAKGNPYYEVMGVSRHWRYSRERMQQLIEEGRVIQTKPGTVPMFKRYLDESKGVPVGNLWTDISLLRGHSTEKLGYPTQKPVALLERILATSSNPGDVVLDPFCGCGTTVVAAERMGRPWIGIDITHLSISLIKMRLKRDFMLDGNDFLETGTPTNLEGAEYLMSADPYQFQFWILGEMGAQPYGAVTGSKVGKKGGDGGVDGTMFFMRPDGSKVESILISVKGGKNLTAGMVRDLAGTVQKAKAAMGVFVCLAKPTKGVLREALEAGSYVLDGKTYPLIQVLTVADILGGARPVIPAGAQNVSGEAKPVKSRAVVAAKKGMQTLF